MKKFKKLFSAIAAGGAVFLFPVIAFASEAGETMKEKLAYAGRNTIIGIGTVFIMLIVIALIIYCFRFLPKLLGPKDKKKKTATEEKAAPKVEAAAKAAPKVAAPASAPVMDDLELVAVITAAIAAGEQVPVGSFVVRTIKRRA